jgi:DNA replication protein DnaC
MKQTKDLAPLLKRLKLGRMLPTLPERVSLARRDQLDYLSFLEVILSDEVARRDSNRFRNRILKAGFEQVCRLEDFDWAADISLDRRLIDAVFALDFIDASEHVLLVGPVGVGKSFLAQALGYAALKAGRSVRFARADHYFRDLAHARLDGTLDRTFRSYLAPDLLILDDLGLTALDPSQSRDFYELVVARHRTSSFVITSNRAVEEWLSLFADPMLGNSALDRLANNAYQVVIEGQSYRRRLSPHLRLIQRLEGREGGAT